MCEIEMISLVEADGCTVSTFVPAIVTYINSHRHFPEPLFYSSSWKEEEVNARDITV
jgi:hypothetical protein